MSLIYFLIILLFSWVFYTVMTRDDAQAKRDQRRARHETGRFSWIVSQRSTSCSC